jgi:hypothetical protein
MSSFLQRHEDKVNGILSGFDRVIFRGSLRSISYVAGLDKFLGAKGILLKDFGRVVESWTQQLAEYAKVFASERNRPYQYLQSPSINKLELVRQIAERDRIERGLICVLACVEPCQTYQIRRNRRRKRLVLQPAQRKCRFFYYYFVDREFGIMSVRIQSWLPFTIQVYINGRHYLAQQMRREGISFQQVDNCFTWIADLPRAQTLLDQLTTRLWTKTLHHFAKLVNPLLATVLSDQRGYFWTFRESEFATDVMFSSEEALAQLYPALIDHALRHFHAENVLRFLGRQRLTTRFKGEVTTDLRKRVEGVRIKHHVNKNSIKLYDKAGSLLRIETTINDSRDMRVVRPVKRGGKQVLARGKLNAGVTDIHRRVDASREANMRYLEALSCVGDSTPARAILDSVAQPVKTGKRRWRPLHPVGRADANVLAQLLDGRHTLHGFRNANLRQALFPNQASADPDQRRRMSAKVSRILGLLRAHSLIRRLPHSHRYEVTELGRSLIPLALGLRRQSIAALQGAV